MKQVLPGSLEPPRTGHLHASTQPIEVLAEGPSCQIRMFYAMPQVVIVRDLVPLVPNLHDVRLLAGSPPQSSACHAQNAV